MSTQEKQKDNLLVKLVKKSVGLPTSDCCSASVPAQAQEQKAESSCCEQSSAAAETSDCGCDKVETSTCGCGQEKKAESKAA